MPPLFTKGPFSSAEHKHPRDCFGSLFLFVPPAVIVYVNPSVNPPFGVLPAPRSGSLLVLPPTKSCPRLWGKWHEVPKGVRLKTAECRELFPPQLRLRSAAPPFHGGAFWCSTNSAYSAVPLRGAIVSMGLRGVQGGLRGEIEIFPGPPAKKVIRKLPSLLFISTPQSRLTPCQLPGRGAFWCSIQFSY